MYMYVCVYMCTSYIYVNDADERERCKGTGACLLKVCVYRDMYIYIYIYIHVYIYAYIHI